MATIQSGSRRVTIKREIIPVLISQEPIIETSAMFNLVTEDNSRQAHPRHP
jgi:hypothetical protein